MTADRLRFEFDTPTGVLHRAVDSVAVAMHLLRHVQLNPRPDARLNSKIRRHQLRRLAAGVVTADRARDQLARQARRTGK